ncbi:MAG: histidinol-phosphate transaminase [Ignavibacteria bacterium]|nr:histidinol-phosphate transaminase [Ignavibacteria bacterium]
MPLVPSYIAELEPYKSGKPISEFQREFGLSNVIKLASNENPLGPSPLAREEMIKAMNDVYLYPDGGIQLREILAEKFHVRMANVIIGNGSESIMANIIRTFLCDDDEMLTTQAPFIGFRVLAQSRGVKTTYVPYNNYHFDLKAIAKQINEHTKIIYLTNPNNPTGAIFSKEEFDEFMKYVPIRVLIIYDEAYFEYAQEFSEYPDSMHYRYDNVITLRTFSKCYGLAGARIGYGFAHDELISNLLKVKLPFEPSTLAIAAGIGAVRDKEFMEQSLEMNRKGMQFLYASLTAMGFKCIPSYANFLMIECESEMKVTVLYEQLLRRGIIVRPLKAFFLPNCFRVTVGTEEQNEKFIEALEKILQLVPIEI